MPRFGFGSKKDKAADGDDPNRSALFGKKGSPAPAENPYADNPYAQSQPASDPYTDSNKYNMAPPSSGLPPRKGYKDTYDQARARISEPPAGQQPGGGAPPHMMNRNNSNASHMTAPPPYANEPPPQGYGNDRYGTKSGYGGSKYGGGGGYGAQAPSQRGPGGYGGLGRSDSNDTDANRDALFGGARERQAQQPPQPAGSSYDQSYGQPGADDTGAKYGGYGEARELTAEEEENAYVDDINRQRREVVKQTVQSTQNSARYKNEALDAAMSTYARLGVQHERLTNTEKHLDHGAISSRQAKSSTAELKRLNGSMFNPNLKNPFTAKQRKRDEEQKVLDESRADRYNSETTRMDGYQANQRNIAGFQQIDAAADKSRGQFKASSAERSKYMFEDEDDPDAMADEDEIERNLEDISGGVSQLNVAAKLIGAELDSQNKIIDRLGNKSEALHDQTALNTARLNKIR